MGWPLRWGGPAEAFRQGSLPQWLLCAAPGTLQTVSGIGTSHAARPDKGKEAGAPRPLRGLGPKGAYQLGAAPALGRSWQRRFLSLRNRHSQQYPPPPLFLYCSFLLIFPNDVSPFPSFLFCGQLIKSLKETELMCMDVIMEGRVSGMVTLGLQDYRKLCHSPELSCQDWEGTNRS